MNGRDRHYSRYRRWLDRHAYRYHRDRQFIGFRMQYDHVEALDRARGHVSRSAWLEQIVCSELQRLHELDEVAADGGSDSHLESSPRP